jgi:hypothetical protein
MSSSAIAGISWQRLTGIFGLAWFALFVLGGIALQGEPLPYDTPIGEARDFFGDNGSRYLWGDYIAGLAFVLCLLPFVVGLRSLLGAAATVVIGDTATAFLDALALGGSADELSDSTIQLLLELDAVAIAAIGLPMALTAISAATVIWRTGVLPRWLAGVAVLSGLLHIVGATFVAAEQAEGVLYGMRFGGMIAFGVFVLGTSVSLIQGREA